MSKSLCPQDVLVNVESGMHVRIPIAERHGTWDIAARASGTLFRQFLIGTAKENPRLREEGIRPTRSGGAAPAPGEKGLVVGSMYIYSCPF